LVDTATNTYPAYGLTYEKFRVLTYINPGIENFFEGRLLSEELEELDVGMKYKLNHSMAYFRWAIKKKIFESDVILLDEFARLIAFQPPGFFVSDLSNSVNEINLRLTSIINKD
jgi:hypothetical protein